MSNYLGVVSPLQRVADQVLRYYAQRSDLITGLLEKFGAQRIRTLRNEIRCTCPLHHGRNPEAFAVWFDRGLPFWKCHTDCHDRGSLTKLVMKKYNVPFEQALGYLCQYAGIQLSGEMMYVSQQTLEEESLASWKRRMGLDATAQEKPNYFSEDCIRFSVSHLYQPENVHILDYLTGPISEKSAWGESKRQFTIPVLNYWEVGYVPAKAWTWKDINDNVNRGWFDNRISMPWRCKDGRLIGFGGRRVDSASPMKYKTLFGTKRQLALYGLHHQLTQETIRRTRRLIVVEGYTDVWRSHMHGAPNCTAMGGTEFTTQQLNLVKAFDLAYVIMFMDADKPGMTAARKGAQQLSRFVPVLIATPPADKDPSDIVDQNEFWTPIVQAKPFTF